MHLLQLKDSTEKIDDSSKLSRYVVKVTGFPHQLKQNNLTRLFNVSSLTILFNVSNLTRLFNVSSLTRLFNFDAGFELFCSASHQKIFFFFKKGML